MSWFKQVGLWFGNRQVGEPNEPLMRTLFQTACSSKIVKNSLRIALVVGSILNLVNQGGSILSGTGISWIHVGLNYFVPYCVASYSASKNELTQRGSQ